MAMVAVFGAALALVVEALAWFDIRGLNRLVVPFAVDALCGVFGYFIFSGSASLRTWLVFFSAIGCGALVVLFYDPLRTFYPLLSSLPFAAVAAGAARATGSYIEKRPERTRSR